MKKTWKQLLGTLASGALLGTVALGTLMGPAHGQSEDDGVVVLGNAPQQAAVVPQSEADEGSVQLGGVGELPASAIQQANGDLTMPYAESPPVESYSVDAPTIHPGGIYGGEAFGAYAGPSGGAIGYAVTQDPEDILVRVGRRNRDVYGIDEGFTSVGAFMTRHEDANTVWFVNPRLLLTDQGRGGLNLGFGQKAYYPELDRVVSLSAWWDFDSGHQSDYHQVGLSFEMIGQNLSLRSNANFVISRDEHQYGATNIGPADLQDDGSIVQRQTIFNEVAYNQADVSVSAPMPLAGQYGWEWTGGAYFLFGGDGRDATGVMGGVESQVTEDLWVNALITSDRVFDTNVSINLEFTVPHAPPSRWFRRPSVRDHLWTTVRRQYRVATDVVEKTRVVPVMVMGNNGQMQQMRLGIIDPNITDNPLLAFGGTGAGDTPWLSVADYMDEALETQQMFGIIAVRSRTDDSDLNLNTTISLLDGQALLGEGVTHSLDAFGLSTITLPIASSGVSLPRLSNSEAPGLNVVTLANNNQVAGFNIDAGGTASGIVGDGVRGFNINRNNFSNIIDGVRIRSLGAPGGSIGVIRENTIAGVGLGSTRGISVEHESGTLATLIRGNTVSGFQGEDANSNGMLDLSEDLNMNGRLDPGEDIDFDGRLDLSEDLNMNGALDSGFGILVQASAGSTILSNDPLSLTAPLGILGNTLTDNGTGLSLRAIGGSTLTADVQNNLVTGSTDLGEDSNRNGLLDFGEDLNGNGVLDFGSGLNVVSNASTISLVTFTGNTGSAGAGNGATFQTLGGGSISIVNPNIDPATMLPATAFTGNMFDGNALDGMLVRADTGSIIFDQIEASIFTGNGDDGLDLETDNAGTIFIRDPLLANTFTNNGDNGLETTGGIGGGVTITIGDPLAANPNTISGNGTNPLADNGAGIFLGTVGGTLNATFSGLSSSNNAGSGALIFLDGGVINISGGIESNSFTNNGLHGLAIVNNNGGRLITPFVADNIFDNNQSAGLFLGGTGPGNGLGTTSLTDLGSVTRNSFNRDVGFTLDPADTPIANAGILIDSSDQRIIATLTRNSFVGRSAAGADPGAGPGISGTIRGTTTAPAPGGLFLGIGSVVPGDVNTFSNNGDAHIALTMAGNTINSIDIQNGSFSEAFDQPATTNFGGEGVHYIIQDTATLTGQVANSTFTNNEGDGLLIEIRGNNDAGNGPMMGAAQLNSFSITDSTFASNGRDTTGAVIGSSNGISISRTERGQYNDLFIDNNLIENNTLNGIMISSVGANQLNLPNMRADTVMITDNIIRTNNEDGIEFVMGADADMAARLDGNLITRNGFNAAGQVQSGRGNGIEVRELILDAKDSRSLTGLWTNNEITDNFDDGLDLSGYLGNELTDLREAGVYTVAPPAAGTMVPVLGAISEWGLVIGELTLNPVGIISDGGNLITRNGGDGIDITGGGNAAIANNLITENGTSEMFGGFLVTRHAGINIDGAEVNVGQSNFFTGRDSRPTPNDEIDPTRGAYRDLFVFSNLISLNNGDGIEVMIEASFDTADAASSAGSNGFSVDTRLVAAQNEITQNLSRGVDVLQRAGDLDPLDRDNEDPDGVGQAIDSSFISGDITLIGNHIKGNQEEGIYIVQTVDNVQNQVSPSEVTINAGGATISGGESLRAQGSVADIDDFVALRLDIHDNEVIGNGTRIVDFPASGLVIRVGTAGGNFGFTGGNFFATSGFNPEDTNGDGLLDNDLNGDGFLNAAAVNGFFGFGSGVSASVTGNLFDGNFGDDILFHSFTATVDPITTTGTWTDMEFTPMNFMSDPLARFDLVFSLNRFNSIEANNVETGIGTSPGNAGQADAGAYYDNAEPVFKSREGMQTPGGPFANNGGIRQRNATRFSSRYITGDQLPPLISPDLGIFKYPGMGNSTFRVIGSGNFFTDQNLGAVTLPQVFIFDSPELTGDPDLIDSAFEANGAFPSVPPGTFGELPWGWDVLEPGTPTEPFTF